MALKVGELVAFIRADSAQFDQKIDQSGRRFESLRGTVGAGARAMAQVLTGVATATAALGVAAVRVGLDYNRMQQSSRAALTTLLGSAEAANAQMDKLDEFAKTSPFAKQVFIQAQQQLIGFGVEAGKVLPILDAIQNAVAAVGGSNDDISELTRIIAQVQSSGKITAETLNQLGARGVDAATLIGSTMDQTGAQIREAITKGSLDAGDAIDALTEGMITRFGGATANIKQQMDGAADRVKGAFRDIGSVIARPFIDPKGGGYLVTWTNDVADGMRAFQRQLTPIVDTLVRRFGPALERVSPSLQLVVRTIDQWDVSRINTQLDRLGRYAPLIAGTSAAIFAMGTQNLPILSSLGITGINPVVAGLAALVAASPELRAAGRDFLEALSPLIPVGQELAGVAADTAMRVLDELSPALRDLLLAAAPVIVAFGEGLAPVLVTFLRAVEPVAEITADLIGVVADLPEPVLAAAAAFALLQATRGPVTAAVGAISTGVRMLSERMALQASLAAMAGTNISTMGALSAVAQVQVRNLGTALKTAFISNPVTLAIAGLAAAFAVWYKEVSDSRGRVDDLYHSLDRLTGAVTENTREVVANQLQQVGAITAARELGIEQGILTDAILGNEAAQRRVETAIRAVRDAEQAAATDTSLYSKELVIQGGAADRVERAYGVLTPELQRAKDKFAEVSGEVGTNTAELESNVSATDRAEQAVRDLRTALDELNTGQIDAEQAQIRFRDAVDRATEAAAESSAGLDINTREGRLNREALLGIARAASDNALAIAESTGSQDAFERALKTGREELVRVAQEFGLTEAQAQSYADRILEIPDKATTEALFDDIAARQRIEAFKQILSMPTVRVGVDVERSGYYANRADGGWAGRFASGGGLDSAGRPVARVPQMAGPAFGRTNIVWGEPETGWEAYISGKPGMRYRNLQILDEAARRLGAIVVPPRARFADGGVTGAAAPTRAGASVSVTVQANEPLAAAYAQQVADRIDTRLRDALAVEGLDLAGVLS